MPTNEIVPSQRNAVSVSEQVADLKRRLPTLVATGDIDAIRAIVGDGDAAAMLLRKRGFDHEANAIMCVKIEAEAELGRLDVDAQSKYEKLRWKMFAIAQDRGILEQRLAKASAGGELYPKSFQQQFQQDGVTSVPCRDVAAAIERYRQAEGLVWRPVGGRFPGDKLPANMLTLDALAEHAGVPVTAIRRALKREKSGPRKPKRLEWATALKIAEAVGADATTWPLAPDPRMGGNRRPNRWLKRQAKLHGGRWDECYSRFRKCLDEFQRLAPNGDIRWDEAYAHFYALNAAIEKQVRKDF